MRTFLRNHEKIGTMFEGKNIHYSQSDQKPLCSCSTKICRQRRLTGFGFCIRHILEDPTAPFQFCSHPSLPGQNKCSNIIAKTQRQRLCNTHLVAAGFPAKRERRSIKLLKAMTSPSMESSLNKSSSPGKEAQANDTERSQTKSPPSSGVETLRLFVPNETDAKSLSNCQPSLTNGDSSKHATLVNGKLKLDPVASNALLAKSPGSKKPISKSSKRLSAEVPKITLTITKDKLSIDDTLLKPDPSTDSTNPVNGLVKHSWGLSSLANSSKATEEQKRFPTIPAPTLKPPIVPSNTSSMFNMLKTSPQPDNHSQSTPAITSRKRKLSPKIKNGAGPKRAKPTCPTLLPELAKVQDLLQASSFTPLAPLILSEFAPQESSMDLLRNLGSQRLISTANLTELSCLTYEPSETKSRSERLAELKADMRRRYLQYARTMPKQAPKSRACPNGHPSPTLNAEKRLELQQEANLTPQELRKAVAIKLVLAARKWPFQTALFLQGKNAGWNLQASNKSKTTLLSKSLCCFKAQDGSQCSQAALPCANLCMRHILYSVDQQLFEFCATSPPCGTPVISVHNSGLPLCREHAQQAETTSNKSLRRRSRSLTNRRAKKSRRSKGKRSVDGGERGSSCSGEGLRLSKRIGDSSENIDLDVETVDSPDLSSPAQPTSAQLGPHVRDMSDAVDMATDEMVGLDAAELAREASRILEEHDLNEVLDKLPEEAFQELFSNGRGTFYGHIHSREETEEFERALAAVDKEVTMGHMPHAATVEESDLVDLNLLDDPALTLGLGHDLVLGPEPVSSESVFYDGPDLNQMNLEVEHALPSILEPLGSYDLDKKATILQTSGRRKEAREDRDKKESREEKYHRMAQSPARGSSPPSSLENQCEPTLAGKTSFNVSSVRNR